MGQNETCGVEATPDLAAGEKNAAIRILIVDDNHDAQQLKISMLSRYGYKVDGVEDGACGWAALQVKHYDLIITDNTMPRMTGIQMIEKLRSANMSIPVIMVTSLMPIFELSRKPWLKPDAAITIPFDEDYLLAVVIGVLRMKDIRLLPRQY